MKSFSLLIKPASADCNLRCGYCFYLPAARNYPQTACHRMDDRTLARVIGSYLSTAQPTHSFGWQGGEPTLMGLPFFRRAVELQKTLGRSGTRVANGLQTNGTLLDHEFAAFLAEYHFLVGVSLDGPPVLHDATRRAADGQGSHARVLAGISALRRAKAEFNILTLVNRANVSHAADVYDDLVEQGFLYHQYIECVDFEADGSPEPFAINGAAWGEFLCAIFDRWYPHDTRRVSVRLFDTVLARMVDGVSNTCTCGDDCRQYFVVEYNGDIYPCDFHVRPEWRLGSIHESAWDLFMNQPRYAAFGARKRQWPAGCDTCPHLTLCHGDCPKNRGRDPSRLSHLCAGWKRFYAHTVPRFKELAEQIRRDREFVLREAAEQLRRQQPDRRDAVPGRNEPCTCGSGRKYKVCCGRRSP
ncbi:MAG: anaerobic sulfatase maturase [bacterium]